MPVTTGPATDTRTWLDDANAYEFYRSAGSNGPAGLTWTHQRGDGTWCAVNIPFRGYGDGRGEWTVILEEPLTVTPAMRCQCGIKAWLDGGRVRPA